MNLCVTMFLQNLPISDDADDDTDESDEKAGPSNPQPGPSGVQQRSQMAEVSSRLLDREQILFSLQLILKRLPQKRLTLARPSIMPTQSQSSAEGALRQGTSV
ncbi:hypothetical protein CRENBAI_006717 [Crenichthys baileyi]|uniref:Uncharacterized protein n=1 Tax=Crenichthys baileyi TaxID=28760 RepID=A0AAV9S947_9TELE